MQTLKRSRFAIALCAAGFAGFAASAAAADDTAAVIQDLKRRIDALEQQLKQQPATAAPAGVAAPSATVATVPPAQAPAKTDDFKVAWGGFVKFDAIGTRFSDGPVAQSTGRDFYVPNSIPAISPGAIESARTYTDFIAKETRLFLKGDGKVLGHTIGTYVEFDFISGQISQLLAGTGNEGVTNAYNPAFRRGFITFDRWTFGQDWSTLQNLVALPDALDFVAWPSDGTVFSRQPVIRYTVGGLQVSIENPETTVAAHNGAAFANTDDNTVPDFVAKYTLKTGFGEYSLGGIVRQLQARNNFGGAPAAGAVPAVRGANDTAIGYGLSFAGKIPLWGKDDLRFTVSGGDGIGRYLAINTVGDAGIDTNGKLHSVEIINGFLAYRHPWNEQWRTNILLSAFHANVGQIGQGPTDFGAGVTRNVRTAAINLLYSPIPKLTLGTEFRYGRRDTVGDLSGDLQRVQLSAKYAF